MTKKTTFANEGFKNRGILEGHENTKPKGRKPKGEKMGKNPLRTYLTNTELQRVREKAGDMPVATYLRSFLREKGFFD
jgi:hypothetical protein